MPIAQNIKTNMLISPLNEGNTISHTHAASVELPWFETTHFQKMYVYGKRFMQCYTAHYVFKVLILWSRKRHFSHLCTQINT